MKLGNIKFFFLCLLVILTNTFFVFAEDKIETVPLINLEELSLIDNGSIPIFERGDIYTIRIDSDGYSWGEINIIPDGINFFPNDQYFQFTISDNYLNRIIFKNLVIKYDGFKKEADSYAQIILEIRFKCQNSIIKKRKIEIYFIISFNQLLILTLL